MLGPAYDTVAGPPIFSVVAIVDATPGIDNVEERTHKYTEAQ